MKNNRGITLTSVMIYVIGMVLAIGVIATITSYFYSNVNIESLNSDAATQFTTFSGIFSYEINLLDNKVVNCVTEQEDG